jgi:acetolactate synthase I/II/III large subunit
MTVAELIVARLREAGVLALFGVPGGGSNLDLIDAAGRAGLRFVLTATETAAALASVAQAEVTGRPGACVTALGPGVASIVNGVACARLERAPLLVLTDRHGDQAAASEHQRLDHRALLAPVTKWSATISVENADDVMYEALARATAPPPGPVHVDIPADTASLSVVSHHSSVTHRCSVGQSPSSVNQGLTLDDRRLMTDSRRPLLLVGLGARGGSDAAAIRRFCSTHRIPVLVTCKAKGVIDDDDPLFAGVFTNGAIERPTLDDADLFVAVGLDRVELLPKAWTHEQPLIAIDGDVAAALRQLDDVVKDTSWNLAAVRTRVASQRRAFVAPASASGLTPDRVVRTVASAAASARVTVDAGAHMFPATWLWRVTEPTGMLISNGLSTMGFALPAAIGAALADPARPVVALTGDGGLLMCAGELVTAAREGLRVTTVVFSDASLSLIAVKQTQRKLPEAGVAIGDVAWCALAESCGVAAHFAATETELERAVAASLAHRGPSLIEARVDPASYADVLRAVRG